MVELQKHDALHKKKVESHHFSALNGEQILESNRGSNVKPYHPNDAEIFSSQYSLQQNCCVGVIWMRIWSIHWLRRGHRWSNQDSSLQDKSVTNSSNSQVWEVWLISVETAGASFDCATLRIWIASMLRIRMHDAPTLIFIRFYPENQGKK